MNMNDMLREIIAKRSAEENEARYQYLKRKRGLPTPEPLSGENPELISLEEIEEWQVLLDKLGAH
jgi:hypothetical protein